MSLTIEVLQLFVFRATDINDLIMNTLGALVGYLAAKVIIRKSWDNGKDNRDILKLHTGEHLDEGRRFACACRSWRRK